ncbi:MAG: 2-hydroxycarboxylate transporter family protein [Vigna little leaf phytoplasma]|nr:2-hydroxycarboxylate transporter family protein [Vigna little leaf phytoplasma]
MEKVSLKSPKLKKQILGFSFPVFILIVFNLFLYLFVSFDGKYTSEKNKELFSKTGGFGNTWNNLITTFLIIILIASVLNFIGNKMTILKKIGGGSILCILVPSFLLTYKGFNYSHVSEIQTFLANNIAFFNSSSGAGFSSFVISSIIVRSFFNMDLNLLKKSFKKFFPLILVSLITGCLTIGILSIFIKPIGGIEGYSETSRNRFLDAIFYIFVPLASGGMAAGITPLSEVYNSRYKNLDLNFMDHICPALLVGGVFSICIAGLIKNLLEDTKHDGKGQLEITNISVKNKKKIDKTKRKSSVNGTSLQIVTSRIDTGLILIFSFFTTSSLIFLLLKKINIISSFIPDNIVILVLLAIFVKMLNIVSKYYVECIDKAAKIITEICVSPLLVVLGGSININKIINRVTNWNFIFICFISVIIVAFIAGLVGKRLGFYTLEASIAAGLCTNSIGGAGNLSILSAADRMELIPFAQIATRLGGALVVVLASITYPIYYGC